MNIVSTLLPPQDGIALLVFDTRVDGRNLVTTLVVGDARKDMVSPIGQQCINRLASHHSTNYPDGVLRLVEIRIPAHVEARVQVALEAANDGDALVFWCRTAELYDRVFPQLGFRHSPVGFDPH